VFLVVSEKDWQKRDSMFKERHELSSTLFAIFFSIIP